MKHVPWTEIKLFHNLLISLKKYGADLGIDITKPVTYRAKVKLHGTCAGVVVEKNGNVSYQSRERIITPEDDNAGFARWASSIPFSKLVQEDYNVVVCGEWAGSGIQKSVAVSQIGKKIFAVFALLFVDDDGKVVRSEFEPEMISYWAPWAENIRHSDVLVLPWYKNDYSVTISFSSEASVLEDVVKGINEEVAAVENCDPFIKDNFGIEGLGEGLVYYPVHNSVDIDYDMFSNLVFKAKGEKHQTVKSSKPAQVDPSIAASANDFAALVLTGARLAQGADTVGNSFDCLLYTSDAADE